MNEAEFQLARALVLEVDPNVSEEEIQRVWEVCERNPWNAPVLYRIIQVYRKAESNND